MVATIVVSSPKSKLLQNPIYFGDPSSNFVGGSLKGLCLHLKPRLERRVLTNLVVASASSSVTTTNASSRFYFNFTGFPFPLGPFLNRRTIRTEVCHFALPYVVFLLLILITELIWLGFLCLELHICDKVRQRVLISYTLLQTKDSTFILKNRAIKL